MRRWLLLVAMAAAGCSTAPEFDLVISGGTVYEGLETTPRQADLGIKGDRIVAIGNLRGRRAGLAIDASGKVVAPGFIDANSRSAVTLLADGAGESHLRQGITTHVVTQPVPLAADADSVALLQRFDLTIDWQDRAGYVARLQQRGTAANVAFMTPVPAGTTAGGAQAFETELTAGSVGAWIDLASVETTSATRAAVQALADPARRTKAGITLDAAAGMALDDAVRAAVEIGQAAQLGTIGVALHLAAPPPPAGPGSLGALISLVRPELQRSFYTSIVVDPTQLPAGAEYDEGLRALLAWPELMIGSHAPAVSGSGALAALATPAAFGAFPRLMGDHVRDRKDLPLGEALRRATYVPATRLGLVNRGLLREGYFADVVVFDETTIGSRATVDAPAQFPTGLDYVVVNGVVVVAPQGYTGAKPGRVLMGPGFPRPTQ